MARSALSEEDRVLWTLIARSTTPLKGKTAPVELPRPPVTMAEALGEVRRESGNALPHPPQAKPAKRPLPTALDRPTHDKLAKGRLPIEGRVDLHGLTQDQAYALLLSFLTRAHRGGVRYVLVITGKGSSSGGDGVLRRSVPGWLATAPFRDLVSGHDPAARNHGGVGAIYIRLRKQRA